MKAGLLTEIIEIYKPTITTNDWGEQSTEYVLDKSTRARLLHNNGNRAIENNELVFNYNKTFEVRMYVDIDELDRIKWNGKYYRILDITPSKALQQLTINCELINE